MKKTLPPLARDDAAVRAPITVARHHQHRPQPHARAATHTYAVLSFFTGGQTRMDLNGEWTVREGDVLLIPPGAPHRMLEQRKPEFWSLSFCVPCVVAEGTATFLELFERVRAGAAAVVQIPKARRAHLDGLFRELQGQPEREDLVRQSLLTLILVEVQRAAAGAAPGTTRGVVVDALRFIERNCLRPLTLKDVAKAVRRSPAYVTTALKQSTGRSAVQWIVSGRMAEARRLLLHSDERVDVVAERVGYADATHFIRMFRREHGMTPATWRTLQNRG